MIGHPSIYRGYGVIIAEFKYNFRLYLNIFLEMESNVVSKSGMIKAKSSDDM